VTDSPSGFSIETLTLPHEDPAEHRQLYDQWMAAYPAATPIEQGLIDQAVTALIEKRRIERVRATVRTDRVRTAILFFDREQEDYLQNSLSTFATSCARGLRLLTRTAAGCRWAIAYWENLQQMLTVDGTWYGEYRIGAIQLQGLSARLDELYLSEPAFRTWLDCLVAQPHPKQRDIDVILDRQCIPKALQDRDVTLWPGNPAESRARLHAIVDRELPRLRALEETLRLQYEEPARAEAQVMALASVTLQEMPILRAERMYEQSYIRTVTALAKARNQTAAARAAAARESVDAWLIAPQTDPEPSAPAPAPPAGGQTVASRSEQRSVVGNAALGGRTGRRTSCTTSAKYTTARAVGSAVPAIPSPSGGEPKKAGGPRPKSSPERTLGALTKQSRGDASSFWDEE
jgi:hypothetical protein